MDPSTPAGFGYASWTGGTAVGCRLRPKYCTRIYCPPVRLSACPPVRLSACPPVRLSACPPVRLTHVFPLLPNSLMRAFTNRRTSAAGGAFVRGNRMVPFDISYDSRSAAYARRIAAVIG
jgi:hypothetical protein